MSNENMLLQALMSGAEITPDFQPQNNKQAYLAYLCGLDIPLPEPRTVEETLLAKMCADGGGGGIKFTGIDGKYLFAYDARIDKMDKILSMCSDLTDLYGMFYGGKTKFAFDMSKIDTSKVTTVEMMFCASRVTSVDMSKNDMSACIDFTSMFLNCSDLKEIIGFSAPSNSAAGAIGFPKGSSSSKYKLRRLTFRTDLPCAIQYAIDIRNNAFAREGMVEMFTTLPDVSALGLADYRVSIYIAGNPCVTDGEATLAAGGGEPMNSYQDVEDTFSGIPLDTEVVLNVNYEGKVSYARLEDALATMRMKEYPLVLSWDKITYTPEQLTDEDRSIATAKGWYLVEE